ncbi:MAG TPA: PssD/Cps14F family polysaccharide biosynthesis glycosyltransferase [Candidatus Diapherotrites archaeon]|nr:PssD/Cps14F family polysaccharide biosynthesis glycosyltransferase [Candidatus Diapherotrites archaeon]
MNKLNALFILGSGGHTAEMIELSKQIKEKVNYYYLIQNDDVLSKSKIIYPGKIIFVDRPRLWGQSAIYNFRIIPLFFKAISIIKKNKIDVIISTGPGISVPFFYAGKLLRKKLIFIECYSRVNTRTMTGRAVYPIVDLFFVQWPEGIKNYPKALYRGKFL